MYINVISIPLLTILYRIFGLVNIHKKQFIKIQIQFFFDALYSKIVIINYQYVIDILFKVFLLIY